MGKEQVVIFTSGNVSRSVSLAHNDPLPVYPSLHCYKTHYQCKLLYIVRAQLTSQLLLLHLQGLPNVPIQISTTDDCCKSPEFDPHSQTSVNST